MKTLKFKALLFVALAILMLFMPAFTDNDSDKDFQIIFVESYNEMIPEQYMDDFRVIIKQEDMIYEYMFDIQSNKTILIQQYLSE